MELVVVADRVFVCRVDQEVRSRSSDHPWKFLMRLGDGETDGLRSRDNDEFGISGGLSSMLLSVHSLSPSSCELQEIGSETDSGLVLLPW